MRQQIVTLAFAAAISATAVAAIAAPGNDQDRSGPDSSRHGRPDSSVQLGPRPFFLVNDMDDSRLKRRLLQCSEGPFKKSDFSIGHRGAALQFPEHTRESYEAGARMGAGILECDVTFTKDLKLVCRHAQNDLHTTTNILVTPLASKCTQPVHARRPRTERERHHARQRRVPDERHHARRVQDAERQDGRVQPGAPGRRRSSWAAPPTSAPISIPGPTSGHLLTHKESIELFKKLGVKMTPELKSPERDHAVQRLHAGSLRPEDDRRVQGRRRVAAQRVPAVVQQGRRAVLDQTRTGLRQAGGVPRRCEHRG